MKLDTKCKSSLTSTVSLVRNETNAYLNLSVHWFLAGDGVFPIHVDFQVS